FSMKRSRSPAAFIISFLTLASSTNAGTPSAPGEAALSPADFAKQVSAVANSVSTAPDLAPLDQPSRDALAARLTQFLSVWGQTTAKEYDALLESWGGTLRLAPEANAQRRLQDWSTRGSDCSIASIETGRISARDIPPPPPGQAYVIAFAPAEHSQMGCVHYCMHAFGPGQDALAKAGQPVVEVQLPVTMHDGSTATLHMRWVLEPASAQWVPWLIDQRATSGSAVCVFYF
ncbi:MAG: hypothetical protein SFZ24_07580, partial [Planctomycetota bacterium]|nr:hypothetical protein [Planctomycetota bacterium]